MKIRRKKQYSIGSKQVNTQNNEREKKLLAALAVINNQKNCTSSHSLTKRQIILERENIK